VPCYKPITGWYSKEVNPSGKRSIVFSPDKALERDNEIEIPCGQCIGCRLERSRQWAIRCLHEAQLHEDNCFITLTFNEEELQKRKIPESLDKTEFQRFMKRLRKKYPSKKIRYFHCGEYGEKYKRPHYHAILFGIDFQDKQLHNIINGNRLYVSKTLEELWPHGYSSIGEVTFESAAYVARYCLKKITGDNADYHYLLVDEETGEYKGHREPEYTTMSRRPGIASEWFEKYQDDVYPSDFITVRGVKMKAPKYYDKLMEKTRPYEMEDLKDMRKENAKKYGEENTRERLDTKDYLTHYRVSQRLPRKLD
jgi:hypothetical protein